MELGDFFLVMGGDKEFQRVTRYSRSGGHDDLGSLNHRHQGHACSKFRDNSGKYVTPINQSKYFNIHIIII